jgi:pimeloyl-ACP methyl ester carboxylesterase
MQPEHRTIAVGTGASARDIAVLSRPGHRPGTLFLGGFMSDMRGSKAEALDDWAAATGRALTRFDYSGHGASGGAFSDGTITRWLQEARAVLDATEGPQILVGSSMGGWIAVLLAQELNRTQPGRVAGLVLLAPAIDMTRDLILARMTDAERTEIETTGALKQPSAYSDQPYLITKALIDDGETHLMGHRPVALGAPVHILQGVLDDEVPYQVAIDLVTQLAQDDVVLTLIKDAGHRLSRPDDLKKLIQAVEQIA